MFKVHIQNILVEEQDASTKRARKLFGSIDRLAISIQNHGLLHPIVVAKHEDGVHDYKLVAGERRLRACMLNGWTEIPATKLGPLSDIQSKEAELEENLQRLDLSWPEKIEALRQLDELKRRIHGGATQGSQGSEWGLQDTADSLGMSLGAVGEDVKLARDLKDNPRLIKRVCNLPKSSARKIVKQEKKAELLRKQIENKKLTISADLRLGNCVDLANELADESIELLITDPPFGLPEIVNVGTHGSMMYNKLESTNVSTEGTMTETYKQLIPTLFNKMVPGAHFYIFFGMGWYCRLCKMLRSAGFVVDDLPLIWHKKRTSMMQKDVHYMSSYEAVLFGHKPPQCRVIRKPIPNVISISAIAPAVRVHLLQKPLELLNIFIDNSSNPGETVLDPFAGSGSTIVAARKLERCAIGFEISENNYLSAQDYINKSCKGE